VKLAFIGLPAVLPEVHYEVIEVDREFQGIVIDNASFDGSADLVRCEFPKAISIKNHRNLGFVTVNNVAARQSLGQD